MRKILIALFLASLMVTVASQLPTPEEQSSTTPEGALVSPSPGPAQCSFRNLYTDYLRGEGVKFRTDAAFIGKQCRGEWKLYGSCCSRHSVNRFAKREVNRVWKVLLKADKLIEKTLRNIRRYLLTFHMYVNGFKKNRWLMRKLSTKNKRKMNLYKRRQLRKEVLPEIRRLKIWIVKNKDNMIERQRGCIRRLQITRINSVCYTCSARAQEFFEKDNLRLHENTCRDIISQCSNPGSI